MTLLTKFQSYSRPRRYLTLTTAFCCDRMKLRFWAPVSCSRGADHLCPARLNITNTIVTIVLISKISFFIVFLYFFNVSILLYLSTFDITKVRSFYRPNIIENTELFFWGFTRTFIGKNTVTLYDI